MVDDVGVVAQAADQDIGSETAVQGIGGVVAGEGMAPALPVRFSLAVVVPDASRFSRLSPRARWHR